MRSSIAFGVLLALASGVCNGLFTTPMKLIPRWKWENLWLVFILTACVAMPVAMVATGVDAGAVLAASPSAAIAYAAGFGFAWGFGAIFFGLSVHHLGVSLANSLVIGLSSALGSAVPLLLGGNLRFDVSQIVLFAGVATFLVGVWLCGQAGRRRESSAPANSRGGGSLFSAYALCIGAGILSAVFNVGYSLALPIAAAGERLGYSSFDSTNLIWLLMLGGGAIPNIAYCSMLLRRNGSAALFSGPQPGKTWGLSLLMGLLWGGSIFLYGAATPMLGDIGPSIGWPLSLAAGLLVANVMGLWLGEWRDANPGALRLMRSGILTLLAAIILCALSSSLGKA
jgi:L-rhamnose-H+ transport protein